ncbi:hypothetical protein BAR24066_01213 [Burkholderia arboris]|uniref:Uncharacterized protein n=1 Tax=Burkholderia arboris TaxID=488730 RepID=A0A9Q9UNZ1_9BURK|nr:hypothetical protein BAR24066_01213 [Burkholderia arboris]
MACLIDAMLIFGFSLYEELALTRAGIYFCKNCSMEVNIATLYC